MKLAKRYFLVAVNFCVITILIYIGLLEKMENKLIIHKASSLQNLPLSDPIEATVPVPFWQKVLCEGSRNISQKFYPANAIPLKIIDSDEVMKPSSDNIFLVETACNPRPTYRAWCGVESWAAQNPTAPVYYVMTSPYLQDPTGLVESLLTEYKNLIISVFDLTKLFKKTPLSNFFQSLTWAKNTDWPIIQLSDMLRVVLVWTLGGFYSDSDIICMKSVSKLQDVVGFESNAAINNGHFHGHPNHPFFLDVMQYMKKHYNPKKWGSLGPKTFTSVMQKRCGSDLKSKKSKDPQRCYNMTLLPQEMFSLIHWSAYKKLIKESGGKNFEKTFNSSYTIHFFNEMMKSEVIKIGSESIYDIAAKKFCPITYRFASSHSQFF